MFRQCLLDNHNNNHSNNRIIIVDLTAIATMHCNRNLQTYSILMVVQYRHLNKNNSSSKINYLYNSLNNNSSSSSNNNSDKATTVLRPSWPCSKLSNINTPAPLLPLT
jgi:hypothetical protein